MTAPGERFADRFLRAWQRYERAAGQGRMTAAEFASVLGVSPALVSLWQDAEKAPPHDRVLKIARVTGTDPGWLAYGRASQAPMLMAIEQPPEETVSRDRGTLSRGGIPQPRPDEARTPARKRKRGNGG